MNITVEVDPIGHGPWMIYRNFAVATGESFIHEFSDDFQARWIRFKTDMDCKAIAWLEYN